MSSCVSRRCSRSCHGEYGSPAGLRPRASAGMPATARSKSACASCQASAFVSCSRRGFNTELTEAEEILWLLFSVVSVVSVLIVLARAGFPRPFPSPPLEELDRPLVLLRGGTRPERAEVLPLPGFRIFFPRIQPVFS